MKRGIWALLAAGLVVAPLFSGAVYAHDDDGGSSGHWDGGDEGHGGMFERWQEKLGITDDQAKKLKEAHKAAFEAAKPLMEKMKAAHKKLKDEIHNKAADSEIKATLAELASAHKALQENMEKSKAASDDILTPTQRAKMMLAMERRMHRGREEWRHHGRHHCGGERHGRWNRDDDHGDRRHWSRDDDEDHDGGGHGEDGE